MKTPILLILVGLVFTSCGESQKKDHTSVKDISLLEIEIDSLFNSYYNDNGPAAAIFISYNGKEVIKKTYGLRNVEAGERATNNTNFNAGSITKQFTALGILNMVDEEKVQLTDTLYKYFPYPIFKNVTIEQLISHTSGIEDADWVVRKNWKSTDYITVEDIMNWYKNNDIIRFNPGTQFEYNNGAYCVLVKLIEEVSGRKFSEYMNEVVFDRIGFESTYLVSEENFGKIPEMAVSYEWDTLGNWVSNDPYYYSNTLVGPTGLYTNLNDYSKYLKALRKHQILEESSHEMIFKPVSMDIELHSADMRSLKGKKSSYAMGWEVTDSLAVSAGAGFGINNWSIFEFKRPVSMVIFTNNDILFKENLVDKSYNIIEKSLNN